LKLKEANEYLKSKRGKKINTHQVFKPNNLSNDKQAKIYHRKRCSNSLSINTSTSPLNFFQSKNPKSKHIQQQLQQQLQLQQQQQQSYNNNNNNNTSSLHSNINEAMQSKDEIIRSQQQHQPNHNQKNQLIMQKTKSHQRQRHFSVDENMINRSRKRNSSSINIDEENGDEYLYEDDIDDVDDDEESNYGNWNEDEDCDVDNDDGNESSELMIDEDDTSSNNNTNINPVKHNTNNSSRTVTPTPTPTPATSLNVVSETHQQNKALKLLSINDSLVPGQNSSIINSGLAKFNFKIIENSNDERQQFKEMKNATLSSFTTDSLNSNSKQQRRSRNSSLCIDNANNSIASSIKPPQQQQQQQQQQPPQQIENFNGINFSKSLISQINSGAANLNATIQSLNSNGTGTKCNLFF
jgi:hypothetical protein